MIWRTLLLAFSASTAFAAGPKYAYTETPKLDDEVRNIYHDIGYPVINYGKVLNLSITSATVTGTLTITGKLAAAGTTTNDSAATGYLGEYVTSAVQNISAAATGTYGNLTSITLTAGDWDVSGQLEFVGSGAGGLGQSLMALSAFSGNTTTDHVEGDNVAEQRPPGADGDVVSMSIANWRKSISSTTTVYIKGRITFTSGTPKMYGRISARRIR